MKTIALQGLVSEVHYQSVVRTVRRMTQSTITRQGKKTLEVSGGDEKRAAKYLECAFHRGMVPLGQKDDAGDLLVLLVPNEKVEKVLTDGALGELIIFRTEYKRKGVKYDPSKHTQIGIFGADTEKATGVLTTASVLNNVQWLQTTEFYSKNNRFFTVIEMSSAADRNALQGKKHAVRKKIESASQTVIRAVEEKIFIFSSDEGRRKKAVEYIRWTISKTFNLKPEKIEKRSDTILVNTCHVVLPKEFFNLQALQQVLLFPTPSGVCLATTSPLALEHARILAQKQIEKLAQAPVFTSTAANQKSQLPVGTDTFLLTPKELSHFTSFRDSQPAAAPIPQGHMVVINNVLYIIGTHQYRKTIRGNLGDWLEGFYRDGTGMAKKRKI